MNPLLIRRRGMIVSGGAMPDYEQNGLVLWLDGILKGSTANAWTDLVAGHVFEPVGNVAFNTDNVQFGYDGNSYLVNTSNTYVANPSAAAGTIEVVAEKLGALYVVFIPSNTNPGICFIERAARGILWRYGGGETVKQYTPTVSKGSYSISINYKKENGTDMTMSESTATYVSSTGIAACVGRSNNSYFNGKVYSVRVYNRHLTEDEIMHNLSIDNARFNLGLTL